MRSVPALATLPLLLSIAACDYYFNGPGHDSRIARIVTNAAAAPIPAYRPSGTRL